LRVAGMAERRAERREAEGDGGLRATEIGDAVHRLLEQVDLSAPAEPEVEQVRGWYAAVSDEELERIRSFVAAYCESELARRVATTFGRDEVPALEAELSAGIARIHAGDFRPTPSEFACATCPALDLVCAGPRLRDGEGDRLTAPLAAVGSR